MSSSERSAQSSTPLHSCCGLKHLPLSAHRGSQGVVVGVTTVVEVGVTVLVGDIMVVRATVLEDGSAVKRICTV